MRTDRRTWQLSPIACQDRKLDYTTSSCIAVRRRTRIGCRLIPSSTLGLSQRRALRTKTTLPRQAIESGGEARALFRDFEAIDSVPIIAVIRAFEAADDHLVVYEARAAERGRVASADVVLAMDESNNRL